MKTIKIGAKEVGEDNPCFIIAEAGVNHNGSLELAKKLVDVAADAGADAIKFQLLTAKGLYVQDAGKFKNEWGEELDIYEIWKKTEVPDFWIPQLVRYCEEKNIIFFSSAFEERALDVLNPYVDAYKIGSSETSHIPLLKKAARTGKSVVFAIGGAELSEVHEAVEAIREEGNNNIAIMHCIAKYPTPLEYANVNALNTLKKEFPGLVLGYSDHSLDPVQVPMAAVYKGAKIFEKHFTLSRKMEGIDHKMSLEPSELKQMVKAIRDIEKKMQGKKEVLVEEPSKEIIVDPVVWGDGSIHLTEEQRDLLKFVRRKIFAMKPIKAGETFTSENLAVLRPGNRDTEKGLHPREYLKILGSRSTKDIAPLNLIEDSCVEW